MHTEVAPVPTDEILALRELHRKEMNCQIILDSWPARGWTDSYLLRLDGQVVGYGSLGDVRGTRKDCIVEFFVLPEHRAAALPLFRKLIDVGRATRFEVQTNDLLATLMIYDCASGIEPREVLFHDAITTTLSVSGATFRKATEADRARMPSDLDGDAAWLIELDGRIVATGGVLFHYNPPFGDIYMSVTEAFRRHGIGSFLIQELKRNCYETGKVPAARCSPKNLASRATLQKAGMLPCARLIVGTFAT